MCPPRPIIGESDDDQQSDSSENDDGFDPVGLYWISAGDVLLYSVDPSSVTSTLERERQERLERERLVEDERLEEIVSQFFLNIVISSSFQEEQYIDFWSENS